LQAPLGSHRSTSSEWSTVLQSVGYDGFITLDTSGRMGSGERGHVVSETVMLRDRLRPSPGEPWPAPGPTGITEG